MDDDSIHCNYETYIRVNSDDGDEIRRDSSSSMAEAARQTTQDNKRGMVLPFEPHSITFDDIVYSVDMPQVLCSEE